MSRRVIAAGFTRKSVVGHFRTVHVPDADTWCSDRMGTDGRIALSSRPDSFQWTVSHRISFGDESTKGYTNKSGLKPRYTLRGRCRGGVIVDRSIRGNIATETLCHRPRASVTDCGTVVDQAGARRGPVVLSRRPGNGGAFQPVTDFAAKMGGNTPVRRRWWTPGLNTIASMRFPKASCRWPGCMPRLLLSRARRKEVDEMAAVGVRGVKVDFGASDAQEAIAAQQRLMKECGRRKLVVNLHGCTVPRGWAAHWRIF